MSTPANNQELVESVVEVTGSTQAEAQHLLTACDNNVEAAVALFFEQEALGTSNQIDDSDPSLDVDLDEGDVRAPIAPVREQLVGVDDDNFLVGAPNLPGRTSRGVPRVKVCPFRDFAREGALMENELQAAVLPTSSNSSRNLNNSDIRARRLMRAIAMGTTAVDHKSRLDDLFRPPTDIAYAGTFQTARTRATELKHWLLVNVQSDSFDSQVLNRDVWSDKEVRKLIRRQFMLWQVDSETAEGRRFVAFYHCNKLPYVCVIDPRTGEELWKALETKKKKCFKRFAVFFASLQRLKSRNFR